MCALSLYVCVCVSLPMIHLHNYSKNCARFISVFNSAAAAAQQQQVQFNQLSLTVVVVVASALFYFVLLIGRNCSKYAPAAG